MSRCVQTFDWYCISPVVTFLICYVYLVMVIYVNTFNMLLFQSFTMIIVRVDTLFEERTTHATLVRNKFWFITFTSYVNFSVCLCLELYCEC